jgi:hypothetical protein
LVKVGAISVISAEGRNFRGYSIYITPDIFEFVA